MPVVINRSESKDKSADKQTKAAAKKAPASGDSGSTFLENPQARLALIAVVVVLVLGLIGWSMGLFGGGSGSEAVTEPPAGTNSAGAGTTPAPGGTDSDTGVRKPGQLPSIGGEE
jgi:hypothetical protein